MEEHKGDIQSRYTTIILYILFMFISGLKDYFDSGPKDGSFVHLTGMRPDGQGNMQIIDNMENLDPNARFARYTQTIYVHCTIHIW